MTYNFLMKENNMSTTLFRWSFEEDQLLLELKQKQNLKSWKAIAQSMNSLNIDKKKTGKQCRERYMNHLQFGIGQLKNIHWTPQQEELLFKNFMVYGPKWVLICNKMLGKSQNSLKNKFYNSTGRMMRRIRKVQLLKKIKNKKPITNQRIIRVFQTLGHYSKNKQANCNQNQIQKLNQDFFEILSTNLIKLALDKNNQEMKQEDIFGIILSIHKLLFIQNLIKKESSTKQQQKSNKNQNCMKTQNQITLQRKIPSCLAKHQPLQLNSYQFLQMPKNFKYQHQFVLPSLNQPQKINKQIHSDLEEEVCRILNVEYIPQNFELIL